MKKGFVSQILFFLCLLASIVVGQGMDVIDSINLPELRLGDMEDFYVEGDLLYVAAGNRGVTIVNISDVTNITLVSNINGSGAPNFLGGVESIHKAGDILYAVSYPPDYSIVAINVSNPANPTKIGSYNGTSLAPDYMGTASGVWVENNLAYVTAADADALVIFNVSTPSNITRISSTQVFGPLVLDSPQDLVVDGDIAYVPAYWLDGVLAINITNSSAPTLASNWTGKSTHPIPFEGPFGNPIIKQGDYLYVSARQQHSFAILNASNPNNLTFIGGLNGSANQLNRPWAIGLRDSFVFLPGQGSGGPEGLAMIDVSNPSTPTLVAHVNPTIDPFFTPRDLYVTENHIILGAISTDRLAIIRWGVHNVSGLSLPTGFSLTDVHGNQILNYTNTNDYIIAHNGIRAAGFSATGSINLSGLTINRSTGKVVSDFSTTSGLSANHTLYLPNTNSGGVYVCPSATILSHVNESCTNATSFTVLECLTNSSKPAGSDTPRCLLENGYYSISGLSGSGAGENPTPPVPEFGTIALIACLVLVCAGVLHRRNQ